MDYYQIVKLATDIPIWILSAVMIYFGVFGFVGLFFRKRYKKTDKINRFGMIIPARNEEKVVAGLIESIKKNNYPQDMIEIFVIAHNCTDRTAEIAREHGATVYEYNNPDECTMGYAFRYLFKCIEKDYGTQNFDGFFLFNADNILDIDYISKMNDAFEHYERKSVITSYRNSKNFGSNLISGMYGMYFIMGARVESCGRTILSCSTRVQGTGYLINSNVVKNGWNYVTLTEDWEFTADQILGGNIIRYCDDAIFYDEQPTSVKIMWRQRVRWSRGHLLVFYARFKELFCAIFKKDTKHRFSIYDITAYILPSPLMMMVLQFFQILVLMTVPLVTSTYTFKDIFLGNTANIWANNGLLVATLKSGLISYVFLVLGAFVIYFTERKRIKNVSVPMKILVALLWPIFLLIQLPIDLQAFFSKNLGWKPIPHADQTSFEHVNQKKEKK